MMKALFKFASMSLGYKSVVGIHMAAAWTDMASSAWLTATTVHFLYVVKV